MGAEIAAAAAELVIPQTIHPVVLDAVSSQLVLVCSNLSAPFFISTIN